MAVFESTAKVRFAHCDPAGIIFYPRYFEILNGVVEDWFDEDLECNFNRLLTHYNLGTPMVDVRTEFMKPCYLDDILNLTLTVSKLGTSSCIINVQANVNDYVHIRSRGVLVCSHRDLSGAAAWPEEISKNMKRFLG